PRDPIGALEELVHGALHPGVHAAPPVSDAASTPRDPHGQRPPGPLSEGPEPGEEPGDLLPRDALPRRVQARQAARDQGADPLRRRTECRDSFWGSTPRTAIRPPRS